MNTTTTTSPGNNLQLALATGAFAICFAVFGSVSAMMPILKKTLALNPVQVSVALAVPVLLGSLGRIPLGMLTDRYGGRLIFSLVMACSVIPAFLMGFVSQYWQLVACGFFIGIALASFSVGVGLVSGWFPPNRQGFALGVYGAGNIGQSLAAFGSPVLAAALGFKWGFWTFGVLLLVWLAVFWLKAENAPRRAPAKSFSEVLKPLKDSKSWMLSLYYFLTFGGFVAMAIYLPIFLTDIFKLTPGDAGARTAGFVLLATLMRPVGGVLADKIGGRRILLWVFPATALMAIFLACPMMPTFTIGALGMAAAIGLGNGAVFKLVPEYFPQSVGAVTGLVGAAGGLGGFFPPLVLGAIRQATGTFTFGFVLLGIFALICLAVVYKSGSPANPTGQLISHKATA
ncbi:MAG TPA: MFS transporter [Blastocatellia bacterium]|nr:MFS transporter [Blastocatellia bacterium]HMX26630.1 MFS transporter [Blastocatellia bacterium]HMZ20633.1 MFS transporter [Blastocatellia bacterium]HNG29880.1 MFS transporter [Blastocatellia bacterium]